MGNDVFLKPWHNSPLLKYYDARAKTSYSAQ